MASLMDMTLEEIIKKNKSNSKLKRTNNLKKQLPAQKPMITDARNKIISKKRTQITDARDILAELAKQKDARIKLDQIRLHKVGKNQQTRRHFTQNEGKFIRIVPNKERDVMPRIKPIVRTVENDIEIIDDPMGEYSPAKPNPLNRKASLQLRIIARNNDIKDKKTSNVHRTAVTLKEKSPPRPPSILKKRPIAALRSENKDQNIEKSSVEYRIIVSNLKNIVTAGDIQELFGDVGGMVESRLVRPGTAEVIYKTQEDAQTAVDLYHNRQLDGQPMNCLLVIPRTPTIPTRSSVNPALYSTNSNVEPDISTFHKVLFSNL